MPRSDPISGDLFAEVQMHSLRWLFAAIIVSAMLVAPDVTFLFACILLLTVVPFVLFVNFFWLAEKERPITRRVITLFLPFLHVFYRFCRGLR